MSHITAALYREPLIETNRRIDDRWYDALSGLDRDVDASILVPSPPTRLETQAASIATVALNTPPLSSGLYRLSYHARITRAGTVSSSLTVVLTWVDGGVTQTFTGAAMTGNTTATYQTGTLLIEIDASSDVSYATTYATAGATTMQYRLSIALEQLPG